MDARITPLRPHVERLPDLPAQPAQNRYQGTALRDYLNGARPSSRHPVRLSARVTAAFWLLLLINVAVSAWLIAEIRASTPCTAQICRLATLGGHPSITLVLTATSLGLLIAMAFATRGLTQAGSVELAVILAAAAVGIVACAGAVLVAFLIALAVLVVASALLLVLVTIGNQT